MWKIILGIEIIITLILAMKAFTHEEEKHKIILGPITNFLIGFFVMEGILHILIGVIGFAGWLMYSGVMSIIK